MSKLAAAMRYRDVAAASDWLCAAFGFDKHLVVIGETGAVQYAQLAFGDAMVMLAPVRDGAIDRYMKQPDEIGGAETQSCYLLVGDADAHYARALAAGAEIILDIEDDDFGGCGFSCRDPEGHIWSFGTHDPWQGKQPAGRVSRGELGARRLAQAFVLLTAVAASAATTAWALGAFRRAETVTLASVNLEAAAREAEERTARIMQERLNAEQATRETAERAALEAREELVRERAAKATADAALVHASQRLGEATRAREAEARAKEAAEKDAQNVSRELDAVRNRTTDSGEPDRIAAQLSRQLEAERAARATAERGADQANLAMSKERSRREAAEQAILDLRAKTASEAAVQAAASLSVDQLRQQLSEQQAAREAAERAAKEARGQLSREQSAKTAAWKALAQLRKQVGRLQAASEPVADYVPAEPEAESPAPASKAKRTAPKRKVKAEE